jgi:succinyl-CoA synthetase alpha subunit
MGHAGAWAGIGEATAEEKYKVLQNAGVAMVDHPENFGNVVKGLLSQAGSTGTCRQTQTPTQRRGIHTMTSLHLQHQQAVDHLSTLLSDFSMTDDPPSDTTDSVHLSISIDRSSRQPCIITSPTTDPSKLPHRLARLPYPYLTGPDQATILAAIKHLQLDAAPPAAHAQTAKLITRLAELYRQQAITLSLDLCISKTGTLHLCCPRLFYDDAAFTSAKRHADLHALRNTSLTPSVQVEAEKSGIVFVKLNTDDDKANANIGTLVNGAGLAMNTLDALALAPYNLACTNFLDTGGKATSETVKRCFSLILGDARVKVIFVNIFGGLTDCAMIAEGIIMAFDEVDMRGVPVVVRLRGTNEEQGQRRIRESGLMLESFDGFDEAARRVGELAAASAASAEVVVKK